MMRLALLRHGATEWSALGRIQGRTDTELSEEGRQWLMQRRVPQPFRAWRSFTSPLQRCLQTCRWLDLAEAAVEPRLIETDWGRWEGRTLAQLRAEQGPAMHDNESRGFDFRPDGGESPREVLARVRPWLAELVLAGEPALALTHRGVIRAVMAEAFDWDMRAKAPVKLNWQCLHVFTLDRAGRVQPDRMNVALQARADTCAA